MKKTYIALIGLGYVGLPLALAFSRRYNVVGFDVDSKKCSNLKKGLVSRDQCDATKLRNALQHGNFHITNELNDTKGCNYYIIAVPTPVSKDYHADPTLLMKACEMVGQVISKGDTVVIESTVWPGMTEELCVPILEKVSGMTLNTDFFVGYSPERINPGDSQHPVERIKKIVSGSTPATATALEKLYGSILLNGTYKAPCIRVAEASKVMENCQRDVLIAFANEMHTIFSALGINTEDVIAAASTKWNFVPLHPGLVGGHCISVDPYYLIDKAATADVDARLLKTARAINNEMAISYARRIAARLKKTGGSSVLLLGFAFKPNCDDIRNTRVADVYHELAKTVSDITVCDPLIDVEKAKAEYGINVVHSVPRNRDYDVIAITTAHDIFARDAFLNIEHKPVMLLCDKPTE
jgi:UDP-N-acetyl-D-galactosamine dehydrogenase